MCRSAAHRAPVSDDYAISRLQDNSLSRPEIRLRAVLGDEVGPTNISAFRGRWRIQANWILQGSAVFTTIDVVCTILPTLALAAVPVGRFARLAGCGRTWKQ